MKPEPVKAKCPWDMRLDERCPKHGGALKDCPAPKEDVIGRIFMAAGMKK